MPNSNHQNTTCVVTKILVSKKIIPKISKTGTSSKQLNIIILSYLLEEKHLLITIKDNGVGYFQAQKEKENKHNNEHKSVGMTLSSRRLALLKKSTMEAEVNIQEMTSKNGSIEGTKVTVKIPI